MRIALSILITTLLGFGAFAKTERLPMRAMSLDWDPIEEAHFYDVEITRKDDRGRTIGQPKTHTTKEANYKGMLEPGYYSMRVRGKDHRKVPGEWSDAMDLIVMLENVKVTQPGKLHILQSQKPDLEKYTFNWQAVPGARHYQLTVDSDDKSFNTVENSSGLSLEVTLPVGRRLVWKLKGVGDAGLESETETQGVIEVWGPALDQPKIAKPETRFVREILWSGSDLDKTYTARADRWDDKTKKWVEVATKKGLSEKKFDLPPEAPGGKYRLIVKAEAPLRRPSKLAVMAFPVVSGDRSPAAEYRATLRESIERTKGWFVIASYFITNIDYKGRNYDNQSGNAIGANFKSNGGTGRLGAGYLPEKAPWGFLGVVDLSGFFIGKQTPTYPSLEINAIRRSESGQIGEIRHHMGAAYRSIPEIVPINSQQFNVAEISSLALHYGIEYWWALSPKLGFQVNAHVYPNLGSVKTPNGNKVTPSLSYQVGLLGSYKLSPAATGLMGYAYRSDNITYHSTSGNKNSVDISGHYLNFFLEWAL